jgi:hypothetical protein
MTSFARSISRHGKRYDYYTEQPITRNSFGQAETTWTRAGTIYCWFSREKRETSSSASGERTTGAPIFYFYFGEAPEGGTRIEVDGKFYEIETPTDLPGYTVADAALVEGFSP